MPESNNIMDVLFPAREKKPRPEHSRFICTQSPAVFEEPYGGRCGQILAHGQDCPQPHRQRPVPFSKRVAYGDHVRRSA